MRSSRHPGPPSTVSGSAGSGRELVYGSRQNRSLPADIFVPAETTKTSSIRRTKIIVILGIALPVLACIIGITAWAVTTDVIRVNPRNHDNVLNSFGHRGKTRINNLESRNDDDIDVFMLNNFSRENNSSKTIKKMPSVKIFTPIPPTSVPAREKATEKSSPSQPKASDIITKLISDMPIPKNSKNFVVFAPVADTMTEKTSLQARRFDGKIHLSHGDDLLAEESVASEDVSQETTLIKGPASRKRKSSQEIYSRSKTPDSNTRNNNENLSSPYLSQKEPNRNERISLQPIPLDSSSNRINTFHLNSNFKHMPHNQNPQLINFKNTQAQIDKLLNPSLNLPNLINPPNPQSFSFQSPGQKPSGNLMQSSPQQNSQQLAPLDSQFLNPTSQKGPLYLSTNQNTRGHSPSILPPVQTLNNLNHPQLNQFSTANQNTLGHSSSIVPPVQALNNLNNPQLNQFSSNHQSSSAFQSNLYAPENLNVPGGPQYFAPKTFHSKANYDNSNKLGSLSSYERVVQSTTSESSKDGSHHHYHHHHHHEPTPMGSEPIGDVNFSDVPNRNDADRLGTVGIGLGGSPRGITVQIGGGGLGLPIGALGVARNIVSALLPRPRIGLNSKVFVGFELGRGRGLLLG